MADYQVDLNEVDYSVNNRWKAPYKVEASAPKNLVPSEATRVDYMPMDEKMPKNMQTSPITVTPEESVTFDPEGSDYDMKSAVAAGMKPEIDPEDGKPHWGSVIGTTKEDQEKYGLPEESYMLLKGKSHETWDKAVQGEAERGFRVKKFGDRYYSIPAEINEEGKNVEINNKSIIDSAYDKLLNTEGAEGDQASDVKTGARGLTEKLRDSLIKNNPEVFKDLDINVEEDKKKIEALASKLYLQNSYDAFSQVEGFNKLTEEEQIAILDNAYNLGYENMLGYKNFMAALKDGTNKDAIFKNLLDTAKIEGKSSKGVAKRRAEAYNVGNPTDPITRVEQTPNGIIYYKGDKEYFRFNAPKAEASKVGIIDIVSD